MNRTEGPQPAGEMGQQELHEVEQKEIPKMGKRMFIPAGREGPNSSNHALCYLLTASRRYSLGTDSWQLLTSSETLCSCSCRQLCPRTTRPFIKRERCFCPSFQRADLVKKKKRGCISECLCTHFRSALHFPSVTPSISHLPQSCVDCLQINENEM